MVIQELNERPSKPDTRDTKDTVNTCKRIAHNTYLECLEKVFACWIPLPLVNDVVWRKVGEFIERVILVVK